MSDVYGHPQYRALLAAVCAAPGDDLPRLVLADWLDEHGEHERAEFIRVQCDLAKIPAYQTYNREPFWIPRCEPDYREWQRQDALRRRERELWQTVELGLNLPEGWSSSLVAITDSEVPGVVIRRGFVAEVRCTLAAWCGEPCQECNGTGETTVQVTGEYSYDYQGDCRLCSGTGQTHGIGPRLVREHPVERVVVGDSDVFRPFHYTDGTAGVAVERSALPASVWGILSDQCGVTDDPLRQPFTTRDDAEAALSAALIAWAKSSHPQEVLT